MSQNRSQGCHSEERRKAGTRGSSICRYIGARGRGGINKRIQSRDGTEKSRSRYSSMNGSSRKGKEKSGAKL